MPRKPYSVRRPIPVQAKQGRTPETQAGLVKLVNMRLVFFIN